MGCCASFRGGGALLPAASALSGGLAATVLEEREFERTTERPPSQTWGRASLQAREYTFQPAGPLYSDTCVPSWQIHILGQGASSVAGLGAAVEPATPLADRSCSPPKHELSWLHACSFSILIS